MGMLGFRRVLKTIVPRTSQSYSGCTFRGCSEEHLGRLATARYFIWNVRQNTDVTHNGRLYVARLTTPDSTNVENI